MIQLVLFDLRPATLAAERWRADFGTAGKDSDVVSGGRISPQLFLQSRN